ncbi:MAG: endonuclease III domain-containing protein, partial [Chloroflexi bacterium]|nr:endonuclease III domain-containing protein [Chloroflexota bacterium]
MPQRDLPGMLREIYQRLYQRYGPQGWWPGDGPLDVVIGAILTQAAAWTNVELAINNLKAAGCWSLDAIHRQPQEKLAAIIRPSGYFNAKARKLKAFARHIHDNYHGDLRAFLAQE